MAGWADGWIDEYMDRKVHRWMDINVFWKLPYVVFKIFSC